MVSRQLHPSFERAALAVSILFNAPHTERRDCRRAARGAAQRHQRQRGKQRRGGHGEVQKCNSPGEQKCVKCNSNLYFAFALFRLHQRSRHLPPPPSLGHRPPSLTPRSPVSLLHHPLPSHETPPPLPRPPRPPGRRDGARGGMSLALLLPRHVAADGLTLTPRHHLDTGL